MVWVIATFHLRRSKAMARHTQEGWHYNDCQFPSYSMAPLRRPHGYSSGRERVKVCLSLFSGSSFQGKTGMTPALESTSKITTS